MDNSETLGTEDTGRTQIKHNTIKRWATRSPPTTGDPCAREGYASYKTTVVLLIYIYIAKSGKSLVSDRGKKNIYIERKSCIVIWDMENHLKFMHNVKVRDC